MDINYWPIEVHSQCQICKCNILSPLYIVKQPGFSFLMMLCNGCGHVQVGRTSELPEKKKEICNYFNGDANQEEKWTELSRHWGVIRKPAFMHILHTIKHLGFKRGRLLDIGSAFGHFLELARNEGYDVFGVDTSNNARQLACDKFNIETFSSFNDIPTAVRPFDIVVCAETLYYLPDVRTFLVQVRRILKPGGLLVLKNRCNRTAIIRLFTMIHQWRHNSLLELQPGMYLYGISLHSYHLFRTSAVHRLLRDTGFKVVRTVNEKSTTRRRFALETIPQVASVTWFSLLHAISLGKNHSGKEITVYAVPSLD